MNDEQAFVATCPIAHRYELDREHDWAALERFADLATRSGLAVSADDFMWMGAAEFADGRTVHSYKHAGTRRHLHIDESGHAYQFLARADGGRYLPLLDPRQAISHALEVRNGSLTPSPRC
jgi:hypothetical protein